MLAAERGHLEVVRILREWGAAIDTPDGVGCHALWFCEQLFAVIILQCTAVFTFFLSGFKFYSLHCTRLSTFKPF